MRKLAWLLIFLFAVAFGITLAAAANEDFKLMLIDRGKVAGGAVYTTVSTKWMELADYVSANGTYFLAYTFGILIVGGVFWVGVAKLLARRPEWMRLHKPSLSSDSGVGIGSSGVRGATPAGATTRPTATTNPAPLVKSAEPTEEESAET